MSKSERAKLIFSVGRVTSLMRKSRLSDRLSVRAAVAMASILEYFTSEILEIAGDICISENKSRLTNRHLVKAFSTDQEI